MRLNPPGLPKTKGAQNPVEPFSRTSTLTALLRTTLERGLGSVLLYIFFSFGGGLSSIFVRISFFSAIVNRP